MQSKLDIYKSLLEKWQKSINLVGPSTLSDIHNRHFQDSLQLVDFIPDPEAKIIDMGSGAGFPGMVLAISGMKNIHLIESDARKAAFLQHVSRETKTPVTVHISRIENCRIENPALITARALAPLEVLLGHMAHFQAPRALFLKGERVEEEIIAAEKNWDFVPKIHRATGIVLEIEGVPRRKP